MKQEKREQNAQSTSSYALTSPRFTFTHKLCSPSTSGTDTVDKLQASTERRSEKVLMAICNRANSVQLSRRFVTQFQSKTNYFCLCLGRHKCESEISEECLSASCSRTEAYWLENTGRMESSIKERAGTRPFIQQVQREMTSGIMAITELSPDCVIWTNRKKLKKWE